MIGLAAWGRFPISVDLEGSRGKEGLEREPRGFPDVGGPLGARQVHSHPHVWPDPALMPGCIHLKRDLN